MKISLQLRLRSRASTSAAQWRLLVETWSNLNFGAARGGLWRPPRASTLLRRRSGMRRCGQSPWSHQAGARGAVLKQGRRP